MAVQEKPTISREQTEQKKELKLDQADQKKVSAPKSLQLHEKFLGKRRFPGNTFGRNRERKDDLEKKVIAIRRVAHTFAGGKRLRLSVCVVVGDRKGSVVGGGTVTAWGGVIKSNCIYCRRRCVVCVHDLIRIYLSVIFNICVLDFITMKICCV